MDIITHSQGWITFLYFFIEQLISGCFMQDLTQASGSFQRQNFGHKWLRQVSYSDISVPGSSLDVCPMAKDHLWWEVSVPEGKTKNHSETAARKWALGMEMLSCSTSDCCTFSAEHFLLLLPSSFCVLLYPVKQVGVSLTKP